MRRHLFYLSIYWLGLYVHIPIDTWLKVLIGLTITVVSILMCFTRHTYDSRSSRPLRDSVWLLTGHSLCVRFNVRNLTYSIILRLTRVTQHVKDSIRSTTLPNDFQLHFTVNIVVVVVLGCRELICLVGNVTIYTFLIYRENVYWSR